MGGLKEDERPYSEMRTGLGNLGIFLWVAIGAVGVWFFDSTFGWVFFFVAVFFVFGFLRKSLCKTCAYCKTCTNGLNKLSELVFGTAELGGLSSRTLLAALVSVHVLLTAIPTVLIAITIVNHGFTASKIALLVFLWLFSLFSVATKRKGEFMNNQH